MPLVATTFHCLRAGRPIGTWTQTLSLREDDSGTMAWERRSRRGGWERERWSFGPRGVPKRLNAEWREGGKSWRSDVTFDASGATVRVTGASRSARFVAPKRVPRGLPTPSVYRRHARAGGAFRFAKYDPFRMKWDTIEARYVGRIGGRPAFREVNANVPATWTYTFDPNWGIFGVDLGEGAALRRAKRG